MWGHASNGRLGLGDVERLGAPERERFFFPVAQKLKTLEIISQVSCGADHTLAFGMSGVWSWGSGAGGKLGHGDNKDLYEPVLISKLRGKSILQIAAGTWHSMAIVTFPPISRGGWLYTWGSGYHGQLAQQLQVVSPVPEVVEYFVSVNLLLKMVAAGSHHCAAVTVEGEMYTWGDNKFGCLGR
jgi:alpha-tubulin suppressor-like RCC1 family protein